MTTPLYITGITPDGKFLLGGVFRMKDQMGFPLDMSYEICKEKGMEIDYCELFCDAWLHDCNGFDSVCRELEMLGKCPKEGWAMVGTGFLKKYPKALKQQFPINVFCKYILAKKRITSKAFMAWASVIIHMANKIKPQQA